MAVSIRIRRDVLYRSLGGETVLINLETGETFALDERGHHIWSLIETWGDRRKVAEGLERKYDVDAATISEDLDLFLEELEQARLVEILVDE